MTDDCDALEEYLNPCPQGVLRVQVGCAVQMICPGYPEESAC